MSFKEILHEVGPDKLLPDKLLPSLLRIKPQEADENIALILAEVLIPGSQGLAGTPGEVTGLTFVNNLPEANAKGAQLQQCLRFVEDNKDFSVNWFNIFSKVQDYLFDASMHNSQPSLASITQLFSALDFINGPLDLFFNFDWWFDKTLLYMLQSIYTQHGAFDIMNLKHLTLCYPDEISGETELLKFVNIAKFEVQVMSKINSQQNNSLSDGDKRLDSWLSQFFELHCTTEPHHVIAGALAIPDKNGYVLDRIDRLFAFMMDRPVLDANLAQLGIVLEKFKELDVHLAIAKLTEYYTSGMNSESLSKVVQAATSFQLFGELLSKAKSMTHNLYVTFALEATNFGYDIKKLLENDLDDKSAKSAILLSLFEVLESRATHDFERAQQTPEARASSTSKPLKVSTVFTALELLKGSQGSVDPERFKNLQLSLLTSYPRLINFGTGHDATIISNEEAFSSTFPPQVEQEMKNYYSKMYNKEMEIKEIVEMLSRVKDSDQPHDQDIFACMIHSLIDEYRFFAEYPLPALASTSLLFGALLQKDLIQGTTLTVALNFIWESCNQPQDSHMFKFAVQSLYNFKSRLHEYPIYCKHLLNCQSLSAHAKMYQIVLDASNGIPCVDSSATQANQPREGSSTPRAESSTVSYNSISSMKKKIGAAVQEEPGESVSDKLLFFVNNSTADNMTKKLVEVRSLLEERYFGWFANYLVTERAKSEPNNHSLYSSLVFAIADPIFYEYVLSTTVNEVDHLLRNFKDSSMERLNLKNLGSWLGKITLANDRALKRDQIAIKYLLVEAFDFNTLPVVIPFVCKILEQASHSKVFRPPNPWVTGILKVLVELYDCADLKLNLKFEVEVLLNAFDLKIKDIEPATLVRSHNPYPEALAAMFGIRPETSIHDILKLSIDGSEPSFQLQQNYQQQAALMQQQHQQQHHQQQQQQLSQLQHLQQIRQMEEQVPQAPAGNQLDASFSNLKGNNVFTQNPNLRRAFQASLARAVRECAVPILSRVSEAVLTTTEALIRKDFATEGDVAKFRKSYQSMAQQLAHSMVVCSGRKILSETIEATMLQLLGNQLNPHELPLAELGVAIQNNVHLCVEIVDTLAASNISELIEERMHQQVIARERHSPGKPFLDIGASEYSLKLPPPLGLPVEGLHENQLNIFSGFGSNSFINRSEQPIPAQQHQPQPIQQPLQTQQPQGQRLQQVPGLSGGPVGEVSSQSQQTDALAGGPVPSQLLSNQAMPSAQNDDASMDSLFNFITRICDKAIHMLSGIKETSLSELGTDHPIFQGLSQALSLCQTNAVKYPELLLKIAQYAVNCLFTQVHENPMSSEIYVVMLDRLCEYSPSTAKDVTWWMVHSVDQRKFNMPVIFSLLKVQLVSPLKLDESIGKLISESNSPVLVKFSTDLLLQVYSTETAKPIALRSEFACTLDALSKFVPGESEESQALGKMRDDLFNLLSINSVPLLPDVRAEDSKGYVQMGYIFVEWVKLLGHSENLQTLQDSFIDKLLTTEILSDPEMFQLFFKAATEISTTAFGTEHEIRNHTQKESFLSADCFAKLIVRIVLKFGKSNSEDAIQYLRNIIGIVVQNLTSEHEESLKTWNERPYFRLFSSILCEWSKASILDEKATEEYDLLFFLLLGEVFNSLQPIIYPGFTFAWISLITHRMFLPKFISLPRKAGYSVAVKLLCSLLRFLNVYSRDQFIHHDVINVIFKAITRIFAALAHDEPDFLIECQYELISAVPPSYVQVKNIILSAVPKGATVINPFSKDLKYDELPGNSIVPVIHSSPADDLVKNLVKKPIDNFLRIPSPALMRSIYGSLKLAYPKEQSQFGFTTVNFNEKLINGLVLYVANAAVEEKLPSNSKSFNSKSSHVSLIIDLFNHGKTEFRYHLINSMVNLLRYPNALTQWILSVAVLVFTKASLFSTPELHSEIQEIMTRVLLERHLVNKPHPWGLSVLLSELLRGEDFAFFNLEFVKDAAPELKVVFEVLARNVRV